jgi:hypothetical protein
MREMTMAEFVAQFRDQDTGAQVRAAAAQRMFKGWTAFVLFRCEQMDSSHLGEQTVVAVGPNCTYKSPGDCEGKWLRDLPSERQYPVSYVRLV